MTYVELTLQPFERTRRITHERAQGGHVYQRPDGSYVLARASWPYPPTPAPVTMASIPEDWIEITA